MANCADSASTPIASGRRLGAGLLAVIGGSVLTSGVAAGTAASVGDLFSFDPDADLIALCSRAVAIDDRSIAILDTVDGLTPRDPRWSAAYDESGRIFDECREGMNRAATIPARTSDGLRAKASLALRELTPDDCG